MPFRLYDEENTILFIPGPIEFHQRTIRELSKKVYGHRTEFFRKLLLSVNSKLKNIFGLDTGEVLMLNGSGTLAMDSAVRSFASKEKIILNLVAGKFSHRFYEISLTVPSRSIITEEVGAVLEWGKAFTSDRIKEILDVAEEKNLYPDVVTMCHNETSTGVINDVPGIAKEVKRRFPDSILIVDGITSVGAVPIAMEEWGVDVYVTGSQKCLETPPGLSFVALSKSAVEALGREYIADGKISYSKLGGYYNHLAIYLDYWRRNKDLPFTGAVSLFYALNVALDSIMEEGIEKRYHRMATMAHILRESMGAMGLKTLLESVDNVNIDKYSSPTVTAITYPEQILTKKLDKAFREFLSKNGILIAGGQSKLKGKIFRIATMGKVGPREIALVVSMVEYAFKKFGYEPPESGIEKALKLFQDLNVEELI